MNREIEFRGKDVKSGEWLYGSYFTDGRCDYFIPHNTFGILVDQNTTGQFTGMTDKHGKKVFEDDIVRRRDSAFGYVDTGVVKYDCHLGAFILEYKSYGRTYQSTFKKGFSYNDGKCTIEGTYSYEVIGNVYDNKDLLTEK